MRGERILLADDNKEFLQELEEILTLSGYRANIVNNSRFALNIARRIKPDLIMLDLKMDGLNGFQVAAELKYLSELEHIPVIAMTGFFKDDYVPLMEICGIKKCLKKPFNPLDVIVEIEKALE